MKLDLAIEFAEVSVWQCVPPLNFSPSETKIIDAEISTLLSNDVIVNPTREPSNYVSGVLIRTKEDGDYRVILNLKRFDNFLKFKHCKREWTSEPKMHLTFVNESCSFEFVELKDAYYLLPIYCPSQWIFTSCKKVLAPPFKYLRSKKHLPVRYIDESLLLGENFEICFKNIVATVAHVRELAFITHPEKSVLIPTQQILFLRFVIYSCKITEERKRSINSFARISFQITTQQSES